MSSPAPMADYKTGLRCGDVHAGLRNVDPNSPSLTVLSDTRLIGMASSLASLVRGQDVIADAEALKPIVAEQLDISPYAYRDVIGILEQAGMIGNVIRQGTKVLSFTESVPFYQDLYDTLGAAWRLNGPNQLEQEIIAVVDQLAAGPIPREELGSRLGLDRSDIPRLIDVGRASHLIKSVGLIDGEVLYSPFFGFENPDLLTELFQNYGSGRFAEDLEAVRSYQGLPIDGTNYPALADAVTRGFIMAPSVETPDGSDQAFATLPYLTDRTLLTVRKPVLDKALAVLACVRCSQHFGGVTSTRAPEKVLRALLDPNRGYRLGPHGSHKRQYQLLYRMQVVDFVPSGNWVQPELIVTEDNIAAVQLAIDLLTVGEPLASRTADDAARELIHSQSTYTAPLQTLERRRSLSLLDESEYQKIMDAAMGRSAL